MTAETSRVVIVGGGLAGWKCAEELRRAGFDGQLTLLSDEAHRPYDRPPLSKRLLKPDSDPQPFHLPHEGSNEESLRLDLRQGVRAVGLEPGAVLTERTAEDGSVDRGTIGYDALVIATGVRARELPSLAGPRVHLLRTFDDALRLRTALDTAKSLLVVGGGFIGAEVATAAHDRGISVTVVEALPVPYARGLGELMGGISGRLAARYGVTLLTGTAIEDVEDSPDAVRVVLGDGSTLEADIAVVGIGTVVNVEWLSGVPADWSRGVTCDPHGRVVGAPTDYGQLYALGDVAAWHDDAHGDHTRFEHWTTAVDQAPILAAAMLADLAGTDPAGAALPEPMVPYFWSDQYGRKIQLIGRPAIADSVEILQGEEPADPQAPGPRKLVAGYFAGEELVAIATISGPVLLGKYRPLLVEGASRERVRAFAAELAG